MHAQALGMRRRVVTTLGMLTLLAACRARENGANGTEDASPSERAAPATFASYDAGVVAGGPGAGTRYAVGRTPTPDELRAWDDDIGSAGAELPAGRGSVAQGAAVYAAQCSSCHGANGEGIAPNPALVGRDSAAEGFRFAENPKAVKTIGNYWPHATTIFDYVRRAMPLAAPGSLSSDQVYAVTAWLLAANDIIPRDAVLDATALRAVKMPYADRFVPDDRNGGPVVK